ncbi:hypothetical protein AGOR_G00168420 [Albula goreensis]|uniref:Hydrocephalus-inducing protein homolog n=1 Tax=Albula goreensis TaxID=1534307 RepID=A0A8T3CXC5_9TELE|nr:hypothetical protein AGOR_G00168420 [Albula goreensis]
MPTSKVQAPSSSLQSMSLKMPEGFKSKVVAPRNPKLVKHEDRPIRLTPSAFAQEMSQTTEQRLANTHEMYPPRILELLDMSETTHQKSSSVDVDQAMFQPFPSEIVFQNYIPSETYEVPLVLRNNDKIPRLVKVVEEGSLYFSVISPLDVCNKVAPGMASTFIVVFTPLENKDYIHRLICVTERERFEVPIRAVGARAVLDFPDYIHFPLNPVKCPTQKTLLVRNIGNCEAKFQLSTQSPFSVEPSLGNLGVGESMQVNVDFLPKTTGDHAQDLILHYHTGEDIYISLYGAATDVNVRLDRNSVIVERTYISMANQRTVTIVNRSDVIIHYQWKSLATEEEEAQQKLRLSSDLQKEEDDEMEQFLMECEADPTLRDRLSLLSRTFQERRRQLRDEVPFFSHDHITLDPLEGDIWPNTTAEVNIIFKPREAKLYHLTVYCDITGRESRLPLRIKGEGIGPKLQFSFDLLDMGNIFVSSRHSYEVLLSNKGHIDAPFCLVPPSSAIGLCFSFTPSEGTVPPGACHAMEVTFSSGILGTFTEEFLFSVEGNPEPFPLTFRGRVMGPTFHFTVPKLDFGDVAFGFPHTLTCCLNNTSLVPLTFGLRIPGDGSGLPSVTSDDQVSDLNRRGWGAGNNLIDPPTEFIITPNSGTVRAQGLVDIKVTLCSNTVQSYSMALVVDVQGVGEEVLALPISARCVAPSVYLGTPQLEFRRCFLGHPYQQSVKLTNESDLPACYGLLSQEYEESPSVLYSSPHPRGVLQPLSSVEVPLLLQAKAVGKLQATVRIAVFGSKEPPLDLPLSCIGEGPVVHVDTMGVDFGSIPVLKDVSRTLRLCNQSPITARFLAQMVRSRSSWRVEPTEGEVPPEGEVELRLVVHLDDTLRFQDKLHLTIQDSQTHTIPVSATGKGTTIVSDRPFAPSLNLGAHFSSGPCRYHFRLTNRGRRLHQLYWMTEGFPQFRRRGNLHANGSTIRDSKRRDLLAPPDPDGPVFSLYPLRAELPPGHSVDMVLEGSSDTPKVVQERLVCHAILGQQSGKERIITADITCQFVSPVLDISSQQLSFYVEKAPGVTLVPLFQPLVLGNVSSLPLSIDLGTVEPFALCDRQDDHSYFTSKSLVLGVGERVEFWVRFDPCFRRDCVSRVAEEAVEVRYRDHPQRDMVALRGEVHFPNLSFSSTILDFGCVLNHTETQKDLTMTNCSPLSITYHWAFLVDQGQYSIRFPRESAAEEKHSSVKAEEANAQCYFSPKMDVDIKVDSNRESVAPKLYLEDEMEETEKRDPENETKEGRGSPKDPPSRSSSATLIKEVMAGSDRLELPDQEGSDPNQQAENQSPPSLEPQSLTQSCHALSQTLQSHKHRPSVGVEQVFDILPIHGVLLPGETQQVTFTFYGHADISGQVLALCQVEGGPTYEISLRGEASLVTYSLDTTEIDLGLQLFDRVVETEITLRNTGKVGFEFSALLSEEALSPEDPLPGVPVVIPRMGYVEAKAEQKLTVYYLPGVPEVFHTTFGLQVSFFVPETITLRGEGIFPRVCLDLPRKLEEERYSSVLKEARESLEREKQREESLSRPETGGVDLSVDDYVPTYDALLQMEVERLLVKENAELLEDTEEESRDTSRSSNRWRKRLSRFMLPEYMLDFGHVILGNVPTHIVKVTNTGPMCVSFRTDRRLLAAAGFSTELDRVRNLPYCETETFEVKFDPRGANLDLGPVDTIMPIQVVGGPSVQVRLQAVVTMPSLTISKEMLQFDTIQCGQCQVITVQLSNREPVPCEWSVAEEERPKKKIDKHTPLHLRRKVRQEQRAPPAVFEVLPPAGLLLPSDRVNVQVKFSPVEGKAYSQRLVLSVAQSSRRALLLVQGTGEEPQLEFSSPLLELGPTLPYSAGEEGEVLVRNPCPFPIEFYCLEYDTQYLEEERILRSMKGYDSKNVLLLPPRAPGGSLPPELLEYYKDQNAPPVQQDQESKSFSAKEEESPVEGGEGGGLVQDGKITSPLPTVLGERHTVEDRKEDKASPLKDGTPSGELSKEGEDRKGSISVGELVANPVSRALARHMGLDLSPEGQAARTRLGISIIMHGAPLSGKTATAVALAKHYGAACLSIDAVVLEAVSSGGSTVGLQARELCARAALEHAQRKAEEDTQPVSEVTGTAGQGTGFLSVEALAKHTAEGSQPSEPKAGPSSISTRNKNSMMGTKRNEGSQPTTTTQPADSATLGMPAAQIQRQLSVSGSLAGDVGLMSCLLPEELLVDILTERLQLSDCHRGVVIDGLETLYSHSLASTLQAVLKALNNRRYIYMVDLSHSFQSLKAKERAQREAEEREQKEREEREKLRLREMDEEEYDALPDGEKERIDLQHLEELRERRRREQERLEREQEERRQQEEQERLREEEELRKRSKKGKKEQPKEEASGKRSQLDRRQSAAALRSDTKLDPPPKDGTKTSFCTDAKDSKESSTEGAREPEETGRKGKAKEGHEGSPVPDEDKEKEQISEEDQLLLSRFQHYEQSQGQVRHTLQYWDRQQGRLFMAPPFETPPQDPQDPAPERQAPSGKRGRKEREKERAERERERMERERLRADAAPLSPALGPGDALEGVEREAPPEGVPHILLAVSGRDHLSGTEILGSGKLPPLEEVLDGLGQGPKGPPIPPPIIYSVVPYPESRPVISTQESATHFIFMAPPSAEEPAEDKKEAEQEIDTLSTVSLAKEDSVTPSRGRGKKGDTGRDSQRERRRTPGKRSTRGTESRSPPLSVVTPISDTEQSSHTGESQQEQNQRLTTFRWIVPANGEVSLKIWFQSSVPGRFEQTLNFELMGTRRRYQLHCRGICAFPAISKDHKTVFGQCKKALQTDVSLRKTFIIDSGVYEYGPLLCRKSRDRYKEGTYPENMEKFIIHNCSPLDSEVHFCFQHDTKAATFLLDPPTITLKPNEKQELKVWAYPTAPGLFEDSVVCCVKENPDPVLFPLSCRGVRLELELERKQLLFDKVLLGRRDTKSLHLRNPTPLPAAWRLAGLEKLGEEFSVTQDHGVIPPHSECFLQMHFRSMKAASLKRAVSLEVSDVDNILGLVQTENIQILAEAYDVALDISFPKGADGGLDFGIIKVQDEAKLSVSLKNKGKYQIAFKFELKPTDPSMPELSSIFSITPQRGSLGPNERPTTVQFLFRHSKEVSIKEQQILYCQVIEPNIAEGGETIACIPIKVSVQSLFSKYNILPSTDINFGPLVYGSRKVRTFTVENKGHFEIRYIISRMSKDQPMATQRKGAGTFKRSRSRESQSGKTSRMRRHDSLQKEVGVSAQTRFTMGVFTVYPGFGVLGPGAQQVVTVDCVADQTGKWEEFIVLDIPDRDPSDHPDGIPYQLVAEVCVPEIMYKDFATIFEEHRICKNGSFLHCEQYMQATGIYVQEENKFIFNNILVGKSAKARFRITNTGKVPCELNLAVKSVLTKVQMRSSDVFEVTPAKMSIPSHSHAFAEVTFSPQTMQTYNAVFEASLEGTPSVMQMKSKGLVFDMVGEGNLPCVCVLRPALRGAHGNPLLQFQRLLVGRGHALPLVLRNNGSLTSQVNIDLLDKMAVFTLKPAPHTVCSSLSSSVLHGDAGTEKQAEFEVQFRPTTAQSFASNIHILVVDNQYEETVVELLGEGYHDVLTFDNLGSRHRQDLDSPEEVRADLLHFGDCHVGRSYQETFTLTNHSSSEVLRFEWPPDSPQVMFSPRVGHLHASCAKEVTVTFCSEQPAALEAQPVRCKVCRVMFEQPVDQVPDWDNRLRTVKWVDGGKQGTNPGPTKKKVMEMDPEPEHSVVENSSRELELLISAVCDYAQFSCQTENIRFKDTLLYQTRAFEIHMYNEGKVKLEFSWQVLMERCGKIVSMDHEGESQAGVPHSRQGCRTAPRPGSALESLASLLLGDPSLPPFTVEPSAGTISPGGSQTFSINFSPLEVADFEGRLVCSVPNLKVEQGPTMAVSGRSVLPYCHFELEDSDYLSSGRRNPELRGPHGAPPKGTLDPNTRVIEITSVGIGTQVCRVFSVVNPTRKPYSFTWRCEDSSHSPFRCLTPKGSIQPGKKVEIPFEFLAQELDTIESFWSFLITEQSISVPFLLVGTAREPTVYLDHAHLNLGSLLVGREINETVYIVNGEDLPFQFTMRENSRYSEAFLDSLVLEPLQGTVLPRDRFPVTVSLNPTQEGTMTFNLLCDVRGKVQPLTMNVKAEGYSMNACVRCEGPEGDITELQPSRTHQLDFRRVELSDKSSSHFLVSNPGKYSLDVQYELWGPPELQRHLVVGQERDTVAVGQESHCTVTFSPLKKCVLKETGLFIKVNNGPVFTCSFSGSAVSPGVEFSFLKHNFGMKFIYQAGMVPSSQTLLISNKGERGVSLECLFSNTAFLEVGFQPNVLPPGGVVEVPLTFYPREATRYQERVIFQINDCTEQAVEIQGQGIEMKIAVEDPRHKVVNLGFIQIGQKTKRSIPIVNNSPVPLTFTLNSSPSLEALLESKMLSIRPVGEVTLRGSGGRCSVEIQFCPRQRMAPFREELQLECMGTVRPLLVLKGCCQGVEVTLDQDYVPFGAVAQRCKTTRRIVMSNTGDIGARFKWDVKKFAPHFSIRPTEGYICPGMEVPFDVTFAPTELSQDLRYDNLPCTIEGGTPLKLTLAASCVTSPVTKEVVTFACAVRSQHTQALALSNRSGQRWALRPSQAYEITYRPLVMTTDGKKHQGSVFFAFPDGTGMLYTLLGTAEPPKAAGTINHEIPCKTPYTEVVPVQNWLNKAQRFRVIVDMIKPERPDSTVTLKGLDYLDVPALAKRNYKLSFFSYKEGLFSAKVTFCNEATQEYLFYYVNFKATAAGVIRTVEMATAVRQTATASVTVDNPLPGTVSFTTECRNADLSLPQQLSVPGLSTGTLMFEYQPLREGDSTGRLTLHSGELGYFHYDLLLRATPAPREKPLYFRAPLGSGHTVSAKFTNYSRVKAEYTCKTDSPEFTMERTVTAAAGFQGGTEVSVEVYYEPCQLGESRALLTLSSSSGGEYQFPLYGSCAPPKPQGPFSIRAGSNVSIPFKNVFPQIMAFSFLVDNPVFTVKGADTIRPKKTQNIVVSFEGPPPGSPGPCSGKLTITSPRTEGHGQSISWVYYLKGFCP